MRKKTLGLLLCMLFLSSAYTQNTICEEEWIYERSYPVDTVGFGYPSYQFNPMPTDLIVFDYPSFNNNPVACESYPLPYGFLQKYPTFGYDTPIYGIATTVLRMAQDYHTGPNPRFVIAIRDRNGEFVVTDSMTLDSYHVDKMYDYYGVDPNNGVWSHSYKYCYEYYFDHPVYMPHAENFFVGSIMDSLCHMGAIAMQTRMTNGILPHGTLDTGVFWGTRNSFDWLDIAYNSGRATWGVFFPIIRPDSLLCGRVENFRMEEWEADHVKLAWETTRPFRDLHSGRFQIALGGLGPRPDTTNLLMFNDTTAVLQGLDSGMWYSAWVRGECDHCGCPMHGDTLIWGPWCGPVQFYLGSHQPGTQGIEDVDTPGPQFSLSPTPASGTVTVATEGLQGTVAILDLKGRELLSVLLVGRETVVDVAALAAGTYVVRVSTAEGFSTKKLTIR